MKKSVIKIILIIVFATNLWSCTKEPGIGGEATISGKVYAKHYNSTFTVLLSEYYVPDTYVYLVFGDDVNYGTRLKTNYDGEFEFNFLYEGEYTIYTYSIDSAAIVNFAVDPPETAIIEKVNINSKDANIDIGDLIIYK
ncbi:MAG TPA: hypothetical protein PLJ00_01915 [Chitinophagales bacterium]|nr:hypothetical protein [Chitinophagales bacterium]HRG26617.1 hypothetical protein [Chitinophagales bacterium]HRH52292.1 hypothetical protein [Chitinophagales bacterium]